MNSEQNWFDRFSYIMDQNIRGVQYGLYCISGVALFLALRSVRPFIKFVKPGDIPRHFIAKKQPFTGKVIKIEYSTALGTNPVLSVNHYPLVPLPWRKEDEGLPVEVSSVDITPNGVSWMQRVLVGNEICFTPLRVDDGSVHSVVYNKRDNVGRRLVMTGLATVSGFDLKLKDDPFYQKYYKNLLQDEQTAEVKQAGVWANSTVGLKQLLKYKIRAFFLDRFNSKKI